MAAFTAKFINSIKAPEKGRQEYYDDSLKGFMLRVTHKGAMTWSVRYSVRGSNDGQQRYTIGTHPEVSLAVARERARDIIEAAHAGTDLIKKEAEEKAAKEAERLTSESSNIETVAEAYLNDYEKHSRRRSVCTVRSEMKHVVERFGKTPIHKLTKKQIEELCADLTRRGSASTARHVWGRIRAFLSWAVEKEMIDINVCRSTTMKRLQRSFVLKKAAARDRILTPDEIRKVLMAADSLGYPIGWYIKMLFLTAQRRSEVAALAWNEISDIDTGDWIIPAHRYKTGLAHLVPLSLQARNLLKKMREIIGSDAEHAFTSLAKIESDHPINTFHRLKLKILQRSGTSGWTLHDIRRTVRSGMGQMKIDRDVAERVLGHAVGTSVNRIYDVYDYRTEKAEALQRWADYLDEISKEANIKRTA